jgi:hypothetical protein
MDSRIFRATYVTFIEVSELCYNQVVAESWNHRALIGESKRLSIVAGRLRDASHEGRQARVHVFRAGRKAPELTRSPETSTARQRPKGSAMKIL